MGLLGNGDDSLTSNTGWGVMPPMNSGADWGSSSTGGNGGGSSSSTSSVGANISGNNHHHHNMHHSHGNSTMSGTSATTTSCWQTPSSSSNSLINNVGRNQMVSSAAAAASATTSINSSININQEQHQGLSSSPKLSSSWAQAAGKGLMASNNSSNSNSNQMSFNTNNNPQANNSSNVINQSTNNNNNNNSMAGSVSSSVSDRATTASSSSMIVIGNNNNNNNNRPNQTNMANGSNNSNYSHDSYSAAMNGSNNNQQTLNSNGTTGSSISSQAFQQQGANNNNNNSSASSSSNENLSGNGGGGGINQKRAITSVNIQDIIGNLCEDVRETLLTEKWRSTVINQDSPWNLPPSPQSSPKDTSQWRCPVNSGTEIWENAVRQKKGGGIAGSTGDLGNSNYGSASVSSSLRMVMNGPSGVSMPTHNVPMTGNGSNNPNVSQPWGPTTVSASIGGTWGEEDDPPNHWMSPAAGNPTNGPTCVINGNPGGNPTQSISNWSTPNNVPTASFSTWNTGNNDITKNFSISVDRKPPVSRKPWGAFDTPDSCPDHSWDKPNETFGTWNPEPKKESGWEKEANDGFKGPVDDGTSLWGHPTNQPKVSGWKDSKFASNVANPKNGYGWNKGASNPNGSKSNQISQNRSSWTNEAPPQQRKSPSWTDDNLVSKPNGNPPMTSWSVDTGSHWPEHTISGNPNNKPGNKNPGGLVSPSNWMNDTSIDGGNQWLNNNNNPRGQAGSGLSMAPIAAGVANSKMPSREMIGPNFHKMPMNFRKEENDNGLRNNINNEASKEQKLSDDDVCRRPIQGALRNERRLNPPSAVPGSGGPGNNCISSYQNREMLQLIQSAIHSGYLSSQVMHQPMSKHNLEVLNELLQQFKLLRAVTSRGDMNMNMNMNINVNQLKQNIVNLQNQIHGHIPSTNSQFVSQPSNRGGVAGSSAAPASINTPTNSIEFFKPNPGNNGNNPSSDLPFDFVQPQGSKLQTWKTPYNKSDDFVRAPGPPLSKPVSNPNSSNWGGFGDDPHWGPADKPEISGGTSHLMDEYEPFSDSFKAWKPKSLEDDTRSPLNIATPKDPLTWNNAKTPGMAGFDSFGPSSFSNTNPWSYFDLGQSNSNNNGKQSGSKKSTWSNPLNANAPDYNINSDSLWSNAAGPTENINHSNGSGSNNKPRPPPGLSGKMSNQNNGSNNSNVWNSGLSNSPSNASSEYLRLRNLTPQIDGSTLKTLCLQHGPLNQFHLSLNHGVAIVRYATRDQAIKAQSALNNCVLGNTTIIADLPSDNEIQQYGANIVPTIPTFSQQSTNNINSLASSWSNGTNASHSHTVVAAVGGNNQQSYQQSQQNQQTRASGVGGGSNGGGGVGSSSSTVGGLLNPASSNQTLPYGASVVGGGGSTHSSSLPFGSNNGGNNAATNNQFNSGVGNTGGVMVGGNSKLDPTVGGWNSSTMMWDTMTNSNNVGQVGGVAVSATSNLWSASGFSTTDRNTPIQSFLPNDLLAGENN